MRTKFFCLVLHNASNLGYTKKDIAACLKVLDHSNFLNTQKYNGIIMDAYKISCQVSLENRDDIYIKLKLTAEYKIVISVGSFHLSR
jgi:hypothetical protein